jgi:hypothetical protein
MVQYCFRRSGNAFFMKKTPWPKSASEPYRRSDRRLSAKLVTTFADRGCHVVSVRDPYGRIPGFLDRRISLYEAETKHRHRKPYASS